MADFVIVETTVDDRALAERIAGAVVEARAGVCARICEVESVFRWDGEIQRLREFVVAVKTTAAAASRVEETIRALHSYDLPEIVVTPILGGSAAYLDWIAGEVSG